MFEAEWLIGCEGLSRDGELIPESTVSLSEHRRRALNNGLVKRQIHTQTWMSSAMMSRANTEQLTKKSQVGGVVQLSKLFSSKVSKR